MAAVEERDLVRIDVGTDDVIAGLGQAGAGDEADVSGADDCYVHEAPGVLVESRQESAWEKHGTLWGGRKPCRAVRGCGTAMSSCVWPSPLTPNGS